MLTHKDKNKDFSNQSLLHQYNCDDYTTYTKDMNQTIFLFCYIVFFSASCPLTPLLVLIIGFINKNYDAYKLFNFYKTGDLSKANGIGIYNDILQFFYYIGILSNISIVLFSNPEIKNLDLFFKFGILLAFINLILIFSYVININLLPGWFKNLFLYKIEYMKKYFKRSKILFKIKFLAGPTYGHQDFIKDPTAIKKNKNEKKISKIDKKDEKINKEKNKNLENHEGKIEKINNSKLHENENIENNLDKEDKREKYDQEENHFESRENPNENYCKNDEYGFNEEGYRLNSKGNRLDFEGNRLDSQENHYNQDGYLLDENGDPIYGEGYRMDEYGKRYYHEEDLQSNCSYENEDLENNSQMLEDGNNENNNSSDYDDGDHNHIDGDDNYDCKNNEDKDNISKYNDLNNTIGEDKNKKSNNDSCKNNYDSQKKNVDSEIINDNVLKQNIENNKSYDYSQPINYNVSQQINNKSQIVEEFFSDKSLNKPEIKENEEINNENEINFKKKNE